MLETGSAGKDVAITRCSSVDSFGRGCLVLKKCGNFHALVSICLMRAARVLCASVFSELHVDNTQIGGRSSTELLGVTCVWNEKLLTHLQLLLFTRVETCQALSS